MSVTGTKWGVRLKTFFWFVRSYELLLREGLDVIYFFLAALLCCKKCRVVCELSIANCLCWTITSELLVFSVWQANTPSMTQSPAASRTLTVATLDIYFSVSFSAAPGSPSSVALCTTSSFDKLRFSAALLSCDVARCVFMKFICKRHNGGLEGPRVQTPQLGLCHTNDRRHGNAINLDRLIEKHCWENTMTWHAFLDINLLNLWNLFATSLKALCPWECSAFAVAVQESVNCKPSIWIIAFLWEQSINMTL